MKTLKTVGILGYLQFPAKTQIRLWESLATHIPCKDTDQTGESLATLRVPYKDTDQTGDPWLPLECPAKTLIRLLGSLSTHRLPCEDTDQTVGILGYPQSSLQKH